MPDRLESDIGTVVRGRLATIDGSAEELSAAAVGCVARAVEGAWDVVIPEPLLAGVADQGALIEACAGVIRRNRRLRARRRPLQTTTAMRVVLTPPERHRGSITQAGVLTEYEAEELASTARCHGRGTRLEIFVPAQSSDAMLGELVERFAWLGDEDVDVTVRRSAAVA